jgi:hypothetical protein
MQNECDNQPGRHPLRRLAHARLYEKPLESGDQIGDHSHGEVPSSAGEIPMIRLL